MPPKRPAAEGSSGTPAKKRAPAAGKLDPEAALSMASTPTGLLLDAMTRAGTMKPKVAAATKDSVVVYWMRNKDLRLQDNRALANASATAASLDIPLIVLHIFSPSDWKSHDVSARRIDFQLRALHLLHPALAKLHVPLYTITYDDRKEIPTKLAAQLKEWNASHVFANIEYEVDELRRDEKVVRDSIEARTSGEGWHGTASFLADFCVIKPFSVLTKQGKPYGVFGPWYKNWVETLERNSQDHIGDAGTLVANAPSALEHPILAPLFSHVLPTSIPGFKLEEEDQKTMNHIWPVGEHIVEQVLDRFLTSKSRPANFHNPPLQPGAETVGLSASKIGTYGTGRNRVDLDGTSHLSAYLATGMISPRQCLRAAAKLTKGKLVTDKSDSGVGVWVSEVAWRDFYQHVLAAWPRVCMGRPFNLKFDNIVWETNMDHLQAWKDGKTGYPIVDAAMRALKYEGYMHNRVRMITATFLTKDLLLDWRLGEKHFMENLVDGDLGSNNGGWQWSASTGTDSQPYFRVFNPTSQSEKSDPTGDYIRHWVPELKHLKGKSIHDPGLTLSKKELQKMGYCAPIVDHTKARIRAIARYKTPGTTEDE